MQEENKEGVQPGEVAAEQVTAPSFEEQFREMCKIHGVDTDGMSSEDLLEAAREILVQLNTFRLTEGLMKKNGWVYPTNPGEVRELIERDSH